MITLIVEIYTEYSCSGEVQSGKDKLSCILLIEVIVFKVRFWSCSPLESLKQLSFDHVLKILYHFKYTFFFCKPNKQAFKHTSKIYYVIRNGYLLRYLVTGGQIMQFELISTPAWSVSTKLGILFHFLMC